MGEFHRGLSFGEWMMLVGVALGALALATASVTVWALGGPSSAISIAVSRPMVLVLLALTGVVAAVSALLFITGLVVYVLAPAMSSATAKIDYASYRTTALCLLLAIIIAGLLQGAYVVVETVVLASRDVLSVGSRVSPSLLTAAIASTEMALLFVLWIRIIRPGVISWREMGLTMDRWQQRFAIGFGTGILIFITSGIIEYLLSQLGIEQTQMQQFSAVKEATLVQFAVLVFAGCFLAPLVEESFFRGYVFKALLSKKGPLPAYIYSALLFAVAHADWRAALPIFATGLILAYVVRVTGSVVPAVVGHGLNNLAAFLALYLGFA